MEDSVVKEGSAIVIFSDDVGAVAEERLASFDRSASVSSVVERGSAVIVATFEVDSASKSKINPDEISIERRTMKNGCSKFICDFAVGAVFYQIFQEGLVFRIRAREV